MQLVAPCLFSWRSESESLPMTGTSFGCARLPPQGSNTYPLSWSVIPPVQDQNLAHSVPEQRMYMRQSGQALTDKLLHRMLRLQHSCIKTQRRFLLRRAGHQESSSIVGDCFKSLPKYPRAGYNCILRLRSWIGMIEVVAVRRGTMTQKRVHLPRASFCTTVTGLRSLRTKLFRKVFFAATEACKIVGPV